MWSDSLFSVVLLLVFGSGVSEPTALGGQTPGKCAGKSQTTAQDAADLDKRRGKYPKEWELHVPKGTKLHALRKQLDQEFSMLPEHDLDDKTPLPIWFCVYLRKQYPDLPNSGPYQYPRTARRILQRLIDNPNSVDVENLQKSRK